ncbi:MAG: peptide deformylase [Patescibacteria group bacterium]|jgi:peptide deformylase
MIRPVLHHPNPLLREVARDVIPEDFSRTNFSELVRDMGETMLKEDGVGLAAPQIGESIRVIVIASKEGFNAFLNPKIIHHGLRKVAGEEGCLSVPGKVGIVKRYTRVTVSALNDQGQPITVKATGLSAIVFQHEIDHLDGILFIDKALSIHDKT